MDTAMIYTKASMVFLAQLIAWFVEKNWGLLLAALFGWLVYQLVFVPEFATFKALVLGPEGLHATGQRVYGVVNYR